MVTPISYVYADLIEASKKEGINYKTIEQVPDNNKREVKEILKKRGIEL